MGKDYAFGESQPARRGIRVLFRQHSPLLLAVAILLLGVGALGLLSLRRTRGHVIYALDDAYIHMAMAKSFAAHGVWGVTPDGFTSTSSGPLWTLLLAGVYALAGINSVAPFIMNLLSACLVLLIVYEILRGCRVPPNAILLALLGVILLTPLPALIFGGMEHTMQTALTLAATSLTARILAKPEKRDEQRRYCCLLCLAPLITLVRFEGIFFVFVVSVGFILRKRARRGLVFLLLGFLPVLVVGIVAKLHGWPWFPTSVLLKSGFVHAAAPKYLVGDLVDRVLVNLRDGKHLVTLILSAVLLDFVARRKGSPPWEGGRVMTGIFVGTGILHLGLARVGWLYRYEAYLMAMGIVVVACRFGLLSVLLGEPKPQNLKRHAQFLEACATFTLLISLSLCVMRGTLSLKDVPRAIASTFEQQYQMAEFLRRYRQHSTVALNDVGAVNFYADIHCLDLWGLATVEVARLRTRGIYGREEIARLAARKRASIAIVHDAYLSSIGGVPPEWVRVGQWQIHDTDVVGGDTVSIYAIDPSEAGPLTEDLAEFSQELPPGVAQSGLYLDRVHVHVNP